MCCVALATGLLVVVTQPTCDCCGQKMVGVGRLEGCDITVVTLWPCELNTQLVLDIMQRQSNCEQVMENCIRQNNAIDIYEDYYGDLTIDRSSDPPSAKTINIYRYFYCASVIFFRFFSMMIVIMIYLLRQL